MGVVERFSSVDDLVAWMREQKSAGRRVFPQGNGTRTTLGDACDASVCSLSQLRGITAYDPSEYLVSAYAGTPIQELEKELTAHGQFLPFDTSILGDGATLGGTIAIGASGPRRQLYGAIRDFVMEVRLVDGLCNAIKGGGRVVKNAAGFDLPKLMVGSLGRLGILTEVTLKVFPRPSQWQTMAFQVGSIGVALEVAQSLAAKPFPIAGMTILGSEQDRLVLVSIAGPTGSLATVTQQMTAIASPQSTEVFVGDEFESSWSEATDFAKRPGVIRTVQRPGSSIELDAFCSNLNVELQIWSGGEVAWIAPSTNTTAVSEFLKTNNIAGMQFPVGADTNYRLGDVSWISAAERLRSAMDPDDLFLPY